MAQGKAIRNPKWKFYFTGNVKGTRHVVKDKTEEEVKTANSKKSNTTRGHGKGARTRNMKKEHTKQDKFYRGL